MIVSLHPNQPGSWTARSGKLPFQGQILPHPSEHVQVPSTQLRFLEEWNSVRRPRHPGDGYKERLGVLLEVLGAFNFGGWTLRATLFFIARFKPDSAEAKSTGSIQPLSAC
jgi:hypothetical protein